MAIVEINDLQKTYDGGFQALKGVSLEIGEGEILALLGPNGAGKTTLISVLCGLVSPTGGQARIGGYDIVSDYRKARQLVGLVPQEISLEPFTKVIDAVRFSRGLLASNAMTRRLRIFSSSSRFGISVTTERCNFLAV